MLLPIAKARGIRSDNSMRLSRQRTEQIVVDYLFENTDFR